MMPGAMSHADLVLAEDLTVAEWIVEHIHDFAVDVGSVTRGDSLPTPVSSIRRPGQQVSERFP